MYGQPRASMKFKSEHETFRDTIRGFGPKWVNPFGNEWECDGAPLPSVSTWPRRSAPSRWALSATAARLSGGLDHNWRVGALCGARTRSRRLQRHGCDHRRRANVQRPLDPLLEA
jgi:hypothetical protein